LASSVPSPLPFACGFGTKGQPLVAKASLIITSVLLIWQNGISGFPTQKKTMIPWF
jgi:hypothetical protein